MFEKKPEISETLEWMLQSRQVGDEILVKTLVRDHYAEIHLFSLSFWREADRYRVSQFVEQVICAGVDRAQEYRQDYPVKVWLFKLAFEQFQNLKGVHKTVNILGRADTGQQSLAQEALRLIDAMPEASRQAFLLRFSQRLSNQQIAYILDLPISEVERRIGLVGDKWLDWLGDWSGSPESEYRFQALFSKIWPIKGLTDEEENEISQRILFYLNKKERRKHRLIVPGELFLVVIAIAIVAGMGRLATEITPRPTSEIVYQTQLVNQVVLISPTPEPTVLPTPYPDHAILYRAEGGETLGDIADRTFINIPILEALNDIPADQPLEIGQKIMIGMTESRELIPTPEGNLPMPSTPLATQELLTSESSQEEILNRIMQSQESWQTLWAEALVIQYGPQGYIGEPVIRRQQIWIIQPYYNYLLDGENGAEVEHVYTSIGGLINMLNLQSGEEISNLAPEQIPFLPDLQQMLNGIDFTENRKGEFEFLRQESIAGRRTVVLDWYADPETFPGGAGGKESSRVHQGRYWVDSTYGLLLRQQKFTGNDLSQLFEETIVTKIEIDVPIPNRLFGRKQPLQTYFAEYHRGDPSTQAVPIPGSVLSDPSIREPIDQ
jgi:DNA-directed RNA polymerase specialized sigma24 family protein